MFSSSRRFNKKISIGNQSSSIFSSKSDATSLDDLKNRLAVRFFIRKSKRFDHLEQQMQHKSQQIALKAQSSPECLVYLGLAPKNARVHNREPVKQEKKYPEFQFPKPRVYECCYCSKVFFHKLLYRRHMIHHMKKIHCCKRCSRGFSTKIARRRHEMACRY